MPDTHDQTTKTETPSAAFAAVRAWIVKHGYSTGGADNIGYLLANLESQVWDRVRHEAKTPHPLDAIKSRIDMRMNDHLGGMKPDHDDSITGFNEAWDIVRDTFAEAMKP